MKSTEKQNHFFDNYFKQHVKDEIPDYKITNYKNIKNKKILVVGLGMGRDVAYLAKQNEVHGIDVSKEGLSIAREKGINVRIANVDGKKLPYPSNFFDIVICKDIFEHILNPLFLLLETRRVIKKNGYLVLNIPNHFFWWYRLRFLFGGNLLWNVIGQDHSKIYNEWDYMHIRFFTWKGLKKLIKEGDFKIKKTFWDFGTLAYYNNPEFAIPILVQKKNKSFFEKLIVKLLPGIWRIFNIIFPPVLRAKIVSLDPGFFCASFYLWCTPIKVSTDRTSGYN